jgi:hypothetical protein
MFSQLVVTYEYKHRAKHFITTLFVILFMNDNVTYGYLVPLLINTCFWFCVYLFYC